MSDLKPEWDEVAIAGGLSRFDLVRPVVEIVLAEVWPRHQRWIVILVEQGKDSKDEMRIELPHEFENAETAKKCAAWRCKMRGLRFKPEDDELQEMRRLAGLDGSTDFPNYGRIKEVYGIKVECAKKLLDAFATNDEAGADVG